MHGKSSPVYYDEELGKALFNGLPKYGLIPFFKTKEFCSAFKKANIQYGLISEPLNLLNVILFVIVHYSHRFSWLVILFMTTNLHNLLVFMECLLFNNMTCN